MRAGTPSSQAAGPGQAARAAPSARLDYVDVVKVILVCVVISAHAGITYGAQGGWFYSEPTGIAAFKIFMDLVVAVGSLFAMGAFFFLAGMFVPASLARKGRRRYVLDRIIRLGVPFLAFVVVVVPLTEWMVRAVVDGSPGASLSAAIAAQVRNPSSGPLWFAGVLLLFSVVVALAVPRLARPRPPAPITWRPLVVCGAAVAVAEFGLRLVFRIESDQVLDVHVWEWGQCAGLFALGIVAGRRGWLRQRVPRRVRRGCAITAGAGAAVLVVMLVAARADTTPFGGGLTWQSAVVALIEGSVAVAVPVLMMAAFADVESGPVLRGAGRAAFGAYLLQTPILVGLAMLLRPLAVEPAVKLMVVWPCGIVLCFALAWMLTRSARLGRFL